AARLAEDLERLRETALDGRDVERLLRAEEPEQVRLRDAGRLGDVLRGRSVKARLREGSGSRLEDLLPALLRRVAGGSRARHVCEYALIISACQPPRTVSPSRAAISKQRCVFTIGRVDRLLERDAEVEQLALMAERVRGGRGAVTLLRGEAGIGKTSLLRLLRDRAGLPFYVGQCEPLSVPEPLGPLHEVAAVAGTPVVLEPIGADRRSLARALQAALTARGPAIAVIEDAHWADPATLDVVRVLARRAGDVPLGLVVTFRDDELAANQPL